MITEQINDDDDDYIASGKKCRSMTAVSMQKCKVCANIRRSSLDRGAPNESGVLENGDAQNFSSKFPTKAHITIIQ